MSRADQFTMTLHSEELIKFTNQELGPRYVAKDHAGNVLEILTYSDEKVFSSLTAYNYTSREMGLIEGTDTPLYEFFIQPGTVWFTGEMKELDAFVEKFKLGIITRVWVPAFATFRQKYDVDALSKKLKGYNPGPGGEEPSVVESKKQLLYNTLAALLFVEGRFIPQCVIDNFVKVGPALTKEVLHEHNQYLLGRQEKVKSVIDVYMNGGNAGEN